MTWSPATTDYEMYFLNLAGVGAHVEAGSVHGHDHDVLELLMSWSLSGC